jgi:hypothetical protein
MYQYGTTLSKDGRRCNLCHPMLPVFCVPNRLLKPPRRASQETLPDGWFASIPVSQQAPIARVHLSRDYVRCNFTLCPRALPSQCLPILGFNLELCCSSDRSHYTPVGIVLPNRVGCRTTVSSPGQHVASGKLDAVAADVHLPRYIRDIIFEATGTNTGQDNRPASQADSGVDRANGIDYIGYCGPAILSPWASWTRPGKRIEPIGDLGPLGDAKLHAAALWDPRPIL